MFPGHHKCSVHGSQQLFLKKYLVMENFKHKQSREASISESLGINHSVSTIINTWPITFHLYANSSLLPLDRSRNCRCLCLNSIIHPDFLCYIFQKQLPSNIALEKYQALPHYHRSSQKQSGYPKVFCEQVDIFKKLS